MLDPNEDQLRRHEAFKTFADAKVTPFADGFDREERFPRELLAEMGALGMLGLNIPEEFGGAGLGSVDYGLMCEAVGRASGSLLSLVTIHGMASQAIRRWGSAEQQRAWLPKFATGEALGGFALTEPDTGSDAKQIATAARQDGDGWVLNGTKKWISGAQIADVFLVLAHAEGKAAAFLVERNNPGVSVKPIRGLLGFRSAMLGEITFTDCRVDGGALVGRRGFGFSHIAGTALDQGRLSIAWGCVGLIRACLEDSVAYATTRKQFGVKLAEHQLIQAMIADAATDHQAALSVCLRASQRRDANDPNSILDISLAKYFSSRAAMRTASDAVQIHGGNGCGDEYSVQRYLRDAKVMEIIEGSNQIQQLIIARYGCQIHAKRR
jgi:glutaryl-CoA dehydrogenase (non-decarboxylating)